MAAPSAKKSPSMQDVARLAGVSTQTVSRVMNNHPYVTEQKRKNVQDAIDALGYRMNATASALSSGRTRTIGVVTVSSGSYASAITLSAIENAAEKQNYGVVSAHISEPGTDSITAALLRLERQGAEAIILAAPLPTPDARIESLVQRMPTVTIGGSPISKASSLDVDQEEVARIATKHLLSLGHHTVWHVSGPGEWADAIGRITGWRGELQLSGRPVPEVIRGDWTAASGYQAGLEIGAIPHATAVFVANDEMAFGVIQGLQARGKNVPEDVSIVSVDDIPLAAYCSPALTTVAQPFAELGESAVQILTRRLEAAEETPDASGHELVGNSAVDSHISPAASTHPAASVIAPTLVVRNSTAQASEGIPGEPAQV